MKSYEVRVQVSDTAPIMVIRAKHETEQNALNYIRNTFGDWGNWINEDGQTLYHLSAAGGCGSAWVEEVD